LIAPYHRRGGVDARRLELDKNRRACNITLTNPDMSFEIPAPSDSFGVALDDGAKILVRRHGRAEGPRLLISHGNGFAIDAYFPYWRLLGAIRRSGFRLS
jgi:hypothetical protein